MLRFFIGVGTEEGGFWCWSVCSPVAGGGDSERLVDEAGDVAINTAEHLAGFGLHLVFLAGDEGDDIVEDVHAADARISCARHLGGIVVRTHAKSGCRG